MDANKFVSVLLSIVALLLVGAACSGIGGRSCGSGAKALLLQSMLSAGDNRSFDDSLRTHGAITGDELPCILDAVDSWSSTKRRNGAKLLVLVGGDQKVLIEAQKKVVLETKDLFVWAKVFDRLARSKAKTIPSELAAKRHDMIRNALDDPDGFIQSVGLKAGVLGKYPGIDSELRKRLDSMDAKMLEVALDALPPDSARAEIPRLLNLLEEYENGTKYKHVDFRVYTFPSILLALIRTEEKRAWEAVRAALEKGYKTPNQVRGVREEFRSFRTDAALIKPEESINKFCYYLIEEDSVVSPSAFDILTTQVWAGKQKPEYKTARLCVDAIENGNLDPNHNRSHLRDRPEQIFCERYFYFLETGENPLAAGTGMKRKTGSDAAKFGKKWLKENE